MNSKNEVTDPEIEKIGTVNLPTVSTGTKKRDFNPEEDLEDHHFWKGIRKYETKVFSNLNKHDSELFEKGKHLFSEEKYALAIECFNKLIDSQQESEKFESAFFFWRGDCCYKMNDVYNCINDYSIALSKISRLGLEKKDGNYMYALYNRGCYFILAGISDCALNDFNGIDVREILENPQYYIQKGFCYCEKYSEFFSYAHALIEFKRAIDIDPGNEIAYYFMGLISYNLDHNYEHALNYIQISLNLSKIKNSYTYNLGGLCLLKMKQYERSIIFFDKAISINNTDPFFYFNKGSVFFAQKHYFLSKKLISKAIEIDAKPKFFWKRGLCYYELGDYKMAYVEINKAVLKQNEKLVLYEREINENYYYSRGRCALKLGDYNGALDDFTKSIELTKDDKKKIVTLLHSSFLNDFLGNHEKEFANIMSAIEICSNDNVDYTSEERIVFLFIFCSMIFKKINLNFKDKEERVESVKRVNINLRLFALIKNFTKISDLFCESFFCSSLIKYLKNIQPFCDSEESIKIFGNPPDLFSQIQENIIKFLRVNGMEEEYSYQIQKANRIENFRIMMKKNVKYLDTVIEKDDKDKMEDEGEEEIELESNLENNNKKRKRENENNFDEFKSKEKKRKLNINI